MSNANGRTAPVVLLVLDGWGWRTATEGNAIAMARTPSWDRLVAGAPRGLLDASGLAVGLPEGQMGNSEVGHLNLGAGRVVPQDLVRIDQTILRGELASIPALTSLAAHLRHTGGTLHLAGLIGSGGVHAIDRHLLGFVDRPPEMEVARPWASSGSRFTVSSMVAMHRLAQLQILSPSFNPTCLITVPVAPGSPP